MLEKNSVTVAQHFEKASSGGRCDSVRRDDLRQYDVFLMRKEEDLRSG